jgi:hypothetical protein
VVPFSHRAMVRWMLATLAAEMRENPRLRARVRTCLASPGGGHTGTTSRTLLAEAA